MLRRRRRLKDFGLIQTEVITNYGKRNYNKYWVFGIVERSYGELLEIEADNDGGNGYVSVRAEYWHDD